MRITLPVGSGLPSGARFTVADTAIGAEGAGDDRRVRGETATLGEAVPVTTSIAAEAGERVFMVTFGEAVSAAVTGPGARNPAPLSACPSWAARQPAARWHHDYFVK